MQCEGHMCGKAGCHYQLAVDAAHGQSCQRDMCYKKVHHVGQPARHGQRRSDAAFNFSSTEKLLPLRLLIK